MTQDADPWSQVGDIYGDVRYRILGVKFSASTAEVKQAYRLLIKQHHPDKGGSPAAFAAIQDAFHVLSDPKKRAVYDTWAKELQFRYVQGVAAKTPGGEGILLDQLAEMGLHCDSGTQLVVVCEVCTRPATKDCWTCGMKICDFCTLKRHWKMTSMLAIQDDFPLHWPLINSPHMATQLAKRELEKKRIEDAHRLERRGPDFQDEAQRREINSFQEAACKMAARPDRLESYDHGLGRLYMWAQTNSTVYVACRIPTGNLAKQLLMDCTPQALTLQALDERLPIIERTLDRAVDSFGQIESYRTPDNRQYAFSLPKAEYGVRWQRLFRGDSDALRCLQPLYTITETDNDVTLEFQLPFWIEDEDVQVEIADKHLAVTVRNELSFSRTYWRNREEEARSNDYSVVDTAESLWCLDEDRDADGQRVQLLSVTLVKPALSHDEVMWKKGRRMDNRSKDRGLQQKGVRFFTEDEDEFGLEDMLQALCFKETGTCWVPAKPYQNRTASKRVAERGLLSDSAQMHLDMLVSQCA